MRSFPLLLLLTLGGLAGCRESSALELPRRAATTDAGAPAAPPAAAREAAPRPPADAPSPGLAVLPYTGATEPHRRSVLTPRVPGPVVKVHVREGDRVAKNAPLVDLDASDYVLRLRQAYAGLAGAKIELDAVKVQFDRMTRLLAEKTIAPAQFEMVEAKYKGTKVAIEAAEVAIAMTRKAIADSVIRAPYDALVVKRFVNEGEYAAAMPPTPLVMLEEAGILDLRIQVPATDLARVKEGDELTITFPSVNLTRTAPVKRVVPAIDPRTRTFSVIVELDNADGTLRSGLFARASVSRSAPAAPAPAQPGGKKK
jgi:RND family efflux transporter MFP subunit